MECPRFSLQLIEQATDGWAKSNLLGSGGYGTVYRGKDPSNPDMLWAVKRARVQTISFRKEVSMWEVMMKEAVSMFLVQECNIEVRFSHIQIAHRKSFPLSLPWTSRSPFPSFYLVITLTPTSLHPSFFPSSVPPSCSHFISLSKLPWILTSFSFLLSSPSHVQVEAVAALRHPNIVRLFGYCIEMATNGDFMEQILVYEFVPNGDLAAFMKKGECVGWWVGG